MPLPEATLHGSAGIAVPTLVSTLAICCVFTSVVFLQGPAKYLFTPLGLAVVFAMLASYGLSRTLTPITIGLLLKGERHGEPGDGQARWFGRFQCRIRARLRADAHRLCGAAPTPARPPDHRADHGRCSCSGSAACMFMFVGRDFFPLIDGGQIQLHVRAPAGTRIETTEADLPGGRGQDPARSFPRATASCIVDNIGLPARAYNLAFSDGIDHRRQ